MHFGEEKYNKLIKEYDFIINAWEFEIRNDTYNPLLNKEICLWTRMKYNNKIIDEKILGDRDEILHFLKDFNIPSTNNQTKVDQSNVKIKQR